MCVISLAENVRPTPTQVEQMWDANPHGGGVAWRAEVEGRRKVRWKKGLLKEEMLQLAADLPLPYVLHFRIPSGGTSSSWLACHPFQVDADATVGFEGETEGYVLFHNGFWTGWKDKMQQIAINGYVRVPSGPWSDSRGLAWSAHHLGLGFLDLVDEKVVAFGPNDEDIEIFGAWQQLKHKVTQPDGTVTDEIILVSNKSWEKNYTVTDHRRNTGDILQLAQKSVTIDTTVVEGTTGGTSRQGTFPATDVFSSIEARQERDKQKLLQAGDETLVEAAERFSHVALTVCSVCNKDTTSGTSVDGTMFCWQCWSDHLAIKQRMGPCQYCRTSAASRGLDNDKWVCMACWETHGRPKVYFPHDAERVFKARAIRSLHD